MALGKDVYRQIGERIAELRQRPHRRLSQSDLAEAIGLSRTSVANLEKGRHRVQIHVLYEIAKLLEVEPADLLPALSLVEIQVQLPDSFKEQLSSDEVAAVERLISGGKVG